MRLVNFNYKPKKDIIIENAYRDPFLKIEDLAQIADTTSKYVRTILSESRVSLMELRKEYARKIEDREYNIVERMILNYLLKTPFLSGEKTEEIDGLLLNNTTDVNNIAELIQANYFYRSYKYMMRNRCWALSTVFLENSTFSSDKDVLPMQELIEILNEMILTKKAEISSMEFTVDLSTEQVSSLLKINNFCPVLKIKQMISVNQDILVLVLVYLNARQISFSLSHNGGLIINRKEI